MITRRQWIGGGIAAAALVAAGATYEFSATGAGERAIVAAIAPVLLDGALPRDRAARADAVQDVLRGLDVAVAGLPLELRAQVNQLFGLLGFPLTRRFVSGVRDAWPDAKPDEIAHFLTAWRYSRVARLRAAYDALHQLIMAAWYGNERAWTAIGYAGPPHVA